MQNDPIRASSGWRAGGARYLTATAMTTAAAAAVALLETVMLAPPFLLFALAVGLSGLVCGFGPMLLQITLGALASDFLFVEPRYELSLGHTTAGLAAAYTISALLSRITAHSGMLRRRSPHDEN